MGIRIKKIIILALCMLTLISVLPYRQAVSAAEPQQKVVRVGWYESTYCFRDQYGRRSGIAYEYQQRIAAHTGWTYEYVEDSWPNLMQMLIDGEIDLMSDVSYTEERAELMLYPALAMGAESYYIYIDANNTAINSEDLQTLSGKRIGVNKGSLQEELLTDWADKNGITIESVALTGDEAFSMSQLSTGEIDALVSLDSFGAEKRVIPICKIGSSDYYFAVNKNRPDLLKELNSAMSAIQDEDPYFNQRMFDQYVHLTKTNAFLNPSLESWLTTHGTVRVGFRDDYLPFCAKDKTTGELTGALSDYLAHASNCLKNAEIHFEAVPFATTDDMIAAIKDGDVDCIFPLNLSTYDSEEMGVLNVNPIMQTEVSVLVRSDAETQIAPGKNLTIAIDEGNINYETFIKDEIPGWTIKTYQSVEDCFRAVSSKEADGVLACNYRLNEYDTLKTRYKLVALPTGETMGLSFAVSADMPELYSILNKIANLTAREDMEYALVSYMQSNRKVSVMAFLKDNWIFVIIFITVVFAALLFLLYKKLHAERRVNEQQKQIEESLRRELSQKEQLKSVTKIAYTDPLTGVKSKNAYLEAEERLNRRIADEDVSEFAMILFDLNDLKTVNDTQGHDIGDRYIKEACRIVCTHFKHSPVYRIGGDEFVAVLEGDDFQNRDELLGSFDRLMDTNLEQGKITVATGCAVYDPEKDRGAHSVLERADLAMYQRKKKMKKLRAR